MTEGTRATRPIHQGGLQANLVDNIISKIAEEGAVGDSARQRAADTHGITNSKMDRLERFKLGSSITPEERGRVGFVRRSGAYAVSGLEELGQGRRGSEGAVRSSTGFGVRQGRY
jgi:hypothetical protein